MSNHGKVYRCGNRDRMLASAGIAKAVQDIVGWARPILRPQDTGGVLIVGPLSDEVVFYVAMIGEFSRFTPEQSYEIALEKAIRLSRKPLQISSWQSRNPTEKQYGGAILTGEHILSFSGFSEHGDEAVVLCAAWICSLLGEARIKAIVAISENPLFEQCFNLIPAEVQESLNT